MATLLLWMSEPTRSGSIGSPERDEERNALPEGSRPDLEPDRRPRPVACLPRDRGKEDGADAADDEESVHLGRHLRGDEPVARLSVTRPAARPTKFPVGGTLAETLRDDIGLTGTEIAVREGHWRAGTVLLDGVPVYPCGSRLA